MMKKILLSAITATVLVMSNASYASWFGNDGPWDSGGWGGDWNPYDEWDPRYWIREMDNELADDDWDRYGPRGGGYGPGYGGYGPGYGGYGPGYGGYGPGPGYGGYGPGYGYAPAPAPYYAPQQQYAPQQYAPQQQQAPSQR